MWENKGKTTVFLLLVYRRKSWGKEKLCRCWGKWKRKSLCVFFPYFFNRCASTSFMWVLTWWQRLLKNLYFRKNWSYHLFLFILKKENQNKKKNLVQLLFFNEKTYLRESMMMNHSIPLNPVSTKTNGRNCDN